MNELRVFHADLHSLSKDANWNMQLSHGCTGAALGFPASAACKDEGGGGVGGGGGRGGRKRRRGRDEGMWRQKGRGGKLLRGGIRNVQLY